jgi:hypothetical protein
MPTHNLTVSRHPSTRVFKVNPMLDGISNLIYNFTDNDDLFQLHLNPLETAKIKPAIILPIIFSPEELTVNQLIIEIDSLDAEINDAIDEPVDEEEPAKYALPIEEKEDDDDYVVSKDAAIATERSSIKRQRKDSPFEEKSQKIKELNNRIAIRILNIIKNKDNKYLKEKEALEKYLASKGSVLSSFFRKYDDALNSLKLRQTDISKYFQPVEPKLKDDEAVFSEAEFVHDDPEEETEAQKVVEAQKVAIRLKKLEEEAEKEQTERMEELEKLKLVLSPQRKTMEDLAIEILTAADNLTDENEVVKINTLVRSNSYTSHGRDKIIEKAEQDANLESLPEIIRIPYMELKNIAEKTLGSNNEYENTCVLVKSSMLKKTAAKESTTVGEYEDEVNFIEAQTESLNLERLAGGESSSGDTWSSDEGSSQDSDICKELEIETNWDTPHRNLNILCVGWPSGGQNDYGGRKNKRKKRTRRRRRIKKKRSKGKRKRNKRKRKSTKKKRRRKKRTRKRR